MLVWPREITMRYLSAVLALVGGLHSEAFAQGLSKSYLCVADAATGFNYNQQSQQWEATISP